LEAAAGAERSSSAPPPPPPPPPAAATAASIDFSDIANWDHRSGRFPLTDEVLRQMQFVEAPRPKHYYAAALLLFMRPKRTNREEIVFQNLMEMWRVWFDRELKYDQISIEPPNSYSPDEVNWCRVRLEVLSKDIKNPDDRKRLGLPQSTSKRGNDLKETQRRTEQMDLVAPATPTNSRSQASSSNIGAKSANPSSEISSNSKRQSTTPNVATPTTPRSAASHADSDSVSGSGNAKAARVRKRKGLSQHADASVSCVAGSGDDHEAGSDDDGSSLTPCKRGILSPSGILVSAKDGRALVAGNKLRTKYQSTYRSSTNTRTFAGQGLSLGNAFKVAVFTFYGPNLPLEKAGNFEIRKALFRTAAYYALSEDGSEEEECSSHTDFPEFLNILCQSTKQMRYSWLNQGRVYYGTYLFSVHRASTKYQSEVCFAGCA
jgi:hypothetical protein